MGKSSARIKALRLLIISVSFALILLLLFLIIKKSLPGFLEVLEHGNQKEIQGYMRGFGTFKGMSLAVLLQFMQIVSIVFPGGPLQLSIGIIFGTWLGLLLCHIGYISSNAIVFLVSRRLGRRMDQLFPRSGSAKKGNFITTSSQPAFMVFLACLIPLLPNGLIPHIAARTRLTFRQFFIAVYFGCIPCLLLLCAVGNNLFEGQYLTAGIFGAILVISIILMYLKRDEIVSLVTKTWASAANRSKHGTGSR